MILRKCISKLPGIMFTQAASRASTICPAKTVALSLSATVIQAADMPVFDKEFWTCAVFFENIKSVARAAPVAAAKNVFKKLPGYDSELSELFIAPSFSKDSSTSCCYFVDFVGYGNTIVKQIMRCQIRVYYVIKVP